MPNRLKRFLAGFAAWAALYETIEVAGGPGRSPQVNWKPEIYKGKF